MLDNHAEQAEALERHLSDMTALTALPATLASLAPQDIAGALAEAIAAALQADLVYLRLDDQPTGESLAAACIAGQRAGPAAVIALAEALTERRAGSSPDAAQFIPHPAGSGLIAVLPAAFEGGLIALGSSRPEFPAAVDRSLLSQAAVWCQASRLIARLKGREAALLRSQRELDDFFENAVVGIHLVGPDGIILRANRAELDMLGYAREEYEGRHIAEFHVDRPVIDDMLVRLGRKEELHEHAARLRCKDGSVRDVRISSNVLWDEGRFIHTRCFTRDVTDRRRVDDALLASENRLRALANAVPSIVWTAAPDGALVYASDQWQRYYGFDPLQDTAGWLERSLHPEDRDACLRRWQQALRAGAQTDIEARNRRHDGAYRWFLTRAVPVRDARGRIEAWYGTSTDIHDRKLAETALAERARLAAFSAKVSQVLILNRDLPEMLQRCAELMVEYLDGAFARLWTFDAARQVLKLEASAGIYTHLDGPHSRVPLGQFKIGRIAQQQRPHLTNQVIGDSEVPDQAWAQREGLVAFAGYPLLLEDRLVGVMALFARHPLSDATLEAMGAVAQGIALGIVNKQAEVALRQQSDLLAKLNQLGQTFAAELNVEKLVQAVTDAATQLTGAQFGAFFYNVVDQKGERLTLYTLSGAPCEAFGQFPLPRNTPVFAPTFHATGIVRSDNIQADPRYGQLAPHHGMPAGHLPVVSYLAVPVVSRAGVALGGLFFGHSDVGMFDERDEQLMVGLAAQAAIALDNARLYEAEQQARGLLEQRVRERTAELERSHEQLRSLASHVESAREEERTYIAREIHDELGQQLTGLKMDVIRLDKVLAHDGPAAASARLHEMAGMLDRTIQTVRRIATDLRPSILDDFGLVAAIEWQVQEWQRRTGIMTRFVSPPDAAQVDRAAATAVFRACQEALTNVARHAEATEVDVRIAPVADQLSIVIRDNGRGIRPSELAGSQSLGLLGMRERVQLAGGRLEIEGVAGQGTTVSIWVPLR